MSQAAVVLSAVPTLFSSDGEVDLDANRTLYKQVAGLLDGLFVAGTTGEFPALDDSERLSLIEVALAEAGPDRVIGHIGAPDARHSARLAEAAVALGASIGRLKYALQLRGRGGTTARMTVDPPDASLSAAIAAEVARLLAAWLPGCYPLFRSAVNQGSGPRVISSRSGESGAPGLKLAR